MTIANPGYVPASVILEMFPWIKRQKLRLAGKKGIILRQPSATHSCRFEYDLVTAKAWAEKRRKRRIFPARTYRLKTKRGRRLIALRILPKRFGVDPETYMKWHREGCAIMGGAKAPLWTDIYLRQTSGTLRQTFFGDLDFVKRYIAKHRELGAASVVSEIPEGWGTLEQAHETGISPFRLRELMRTRKVKHKWLHWPVGDDGMTRKKIVLMKDVLKFTNEKLEETLRYPGLIVAHETGVPVKTLKYLFEVKRLTFMEKKPALDPRGHIQDQWHFLKTEIDEHKPRLDQRSKLGSRRYWIDGKDFYPNLEALAICGCTSFELWKWRPISAGGLGQLCPYLFDKESGANRYISCKDGGRTYGSKYRNVPLYSGDDLRLIEAGKKGLPEPAPAPMPPADKSDEALADIREKVQSLPKIDRTTEQTLSRISERPAGPIIHADGPGPNRTFWWNKKSAELQPKDWAVLDYVWRQSPRTAEIETMLDALNDDASEKAMTNRVARIAEALSKVGCSFQIRKKSGSIIID